VYLLLQALRETKFMSLPFTLPEPFLIAFALYQLDGCRVHVGACWDGSFEGLVESWLI